MRVIGERLLIEQVAIKRETTILSIDGDNLGSDSYLITNKVIKIGNEVKNPEIKVGEIPIFSEFVNFGNVKIIEKSESRIVSHIIVHYDDIIGVDEDIK